MLIWISGCKNMSENATLSSNDDICLNLSLITPINSEIERLERATREEILSNNEVYCNFCSEFNDICEDVE